MNKNALVNVSEDTVNVVIFAGGKFRENTFHVGVIFTMFLIFSS